MPKSVYNVIDEPFFQIPLDQVCIPGLHITLGVYLKMFKMFDACCLDIDIEIAAIYARNSTVPDDDFGQYVYKMKELHCLQNEVEELEGRRELLQGELNWFTVSHDCPGLDAYLDAIKLIDLEIIEKNNTISDIEQKMSESSANVGPCVQSLDSTLKSIGVQRQAYHSNSFVENDCHILLKDKNNEKLCYSIYHLLTELNLNDDEFILQSKIKCEKFELFFKKYGACHLLFNAARLLHDSEIEILESSIQNQLQIAYARGSCC